MSTNKTSDVSRREAPPEQAADENSSPISRRALLTSVFALSVGFAVGLDSEPAEAGWRLWGGFIPVYVRSGRSHRYGGGRGRHYAARQRHRGRVARRGGGAGSGSASASNGGSGSGGLGKADY
jgi:hypothetical protein